MCNALSFAVSSCGCIFAVMTEVFHLLLPIMYSFDFSVFHSGDVYVYSFFLEVCVNNEEIIGSAEIQLSCQSPASLQLPSLSSCNYFPF